MRLHLKNIGKIKTADVEIGGLTLIAGENDTGKSTIGKVLFSLIKAINNPNYSTKNKIKKCYDLFINHIPKLGFKANLQIEDIKIMNIVDDYNTTILRYFKSFMNIKKVNKKNISEFIEILKEERESLSQSDFIYPIKKQFLNELDNFIENIWEIENGDITSQDLKEFFVEEFKNDLMNKNENESKIEFDNFTFSLLKQNRWYNIENSSKKEYFSYEDITLIDTPFILMFSELIVKNSNKIIKHQGDLLEKIKKIKTKEINDIVSTDNKNLLIKIREIIGGCWVYSDNKKDFIFCKDNIGADNEISSWNTASGIKSFAIIEALIKSEKYLSKYSPLIIDEPEVHLHPEYQLKYAEVIVELVKNDIPVIITTHSSKFIAALMSFVRNGKDNKGESLINKTHFAFADAVNSTIISDENSYKNIIKTLSTSTLKILNDDIIKKG